MVGVGLPAGACGAPERASRVKLRRFLIQMRILIIDQTSAVEALSPGVVTVN